MFRSTDVWSHGPVFSLALVPFSNRFGTPLPNPPHSGTSVHLMSTPLRGSVSSLACRPMSSSDSICNSSSSQLADIVLFEFFLIKNVLFSSPIDSVIYPHKKRTSTVRSFNNDNNGIEIESTEIDYCKPDECLKYAFTPGFHDFFLII